MWLRTSYELVHGQDASYTHACATTYRNTHQIELIQAEIPNTHPNVSSAEPPLRYTYVDYGTEVDPVTQSLLPLELVLFDDGDSRTKKTTLYRDTRYRVTSASFDPSSSNVPSTLLAIRYGYDSSSAVVDATDVTTWVVSEVPTFRVPFMDDGEPLIMYDWLEIVWRAEGDTADTTVRLRIANFSHTLTVPPGRYPSIAALVDACNAALPSVVRMRYDAVTGIATLDAYGTRVFHVYVPAETGVASSSLAYLLGFRFRRTDDAPGTFFLNHVEGALNVSIDAPFYAQLRDTPPVLRVSVGDVPSRGTEFVLPVPSTGDSIRVSHPDTIPIVTLNPPRNVHTLRVELRAFDTRNQPHAMLFKIRHEDTLP